MKDTHFAWPVAFNPNYGTEYSVYEGAKSNFYCGKVHVDDSEPQYSFDVPEGTNYFAIRYVQPAVSAIFIDDITFAQFGNNAELLGYDIYCDGEKLNENMLISTEFVHATRIPRY